MFSRAEILSEIMPFGMEDYHEAMDEDVPEGWYENDLHLAAELGKTLLERNKDLEATLLSSQQQNEEQATQIVYLEKQLHILRDITESKAHIYEQLDISSQDLEQDNQRLKHDLKTAQQRVVGMTESIDTLEAQVHDQQALIDQLRAAEKERLREGRRQQRSHDAMVLNGWGGLPLRRAHSFDLGKPSAESMYEEELSTLQLASRTLKQELALKEQRENELESEMAVLVRENKVLENHNRELQVKSRMMEIKRDYRSLDNLNEAVCKYCDSVISFEDGGDNFEKANGSEERDGEMKRYGSLDLTPIVEELCEETRCPLPDHDLIHSGSSDGVSLLGEIDAQYHTLMDKYNTLLTRSRSASFHESGNRSRTNSLRRKKQTDTSYHHELCEKNASPTKASSSSLNSLGSSPPAASSMTSHENLTSQEIRPSCPVDQHFESGPPEYKALFKKIYDVLHRPLKKHSAKKDES